jgi:hypothetical protein
MTYQFVGNPSGFGGAYEHVSGGVGQTTGNTVGLPGNGDKK